MRCIGGQLCAYSGFIRGPNSFRYLREDGDRGRPVNSDKTATASLRVVHRVSDPFCMIGITDQSNRCLSNRPLQNAQDGLSMRRRAPCVGNERSDAVSHRYPGLARGVKKAVRSAHCRPRTNRMTLSSRTLAVSQVNQRIAPVGESCGSMPPSPGDCSCALINERRT
jgi:hypothetical protein